MILKDILEKAVGKAQGNNYADSIENSIADGYVDIKAYDETKGGKLVYHDAGDNTVTDWMRHVIMILLTGSVYSANGNGTITKITDSAVTTDQFSTVCNSSDCHTKSSALVGLNYDGYILNGGQYFWNNTDLVDHYSKSSDNLAENLYPVFPTKVLFGTGKEYASWETLRSENETENVSWYNSMLEEFGGGAVSEASSTFAQNITTTAVSSASNKNCNVVSGSVSNNVYTSTSASIARMRTVNDPDSSTLLTTTSSMSKNYGVVGPIKTMYFNSSTDSAKLISTITDEGRLAVPAYRGVGRPCFIYFNTPTTESWSSTSTGTEITLSYDSAKSYLNKITYQITMPSQTSADNAVGAYYPYNGFTLKQLGLYNDARLSRVTNASNVPSESTQIPYKNMPCGTLCAVKNIASFTKTADLKVVLTWTLTI